MGANPTGAKCGFRLWSPLSDLAGDGFRPGGFVELKTRLSGNGRRHSRVCIHIGASHQVTLVSGTGPYST